MDAGAAVGSGIAVTSAGVASVTTWLAVVATVVMWDDGTLPVVPKTLTTNRPSPNATAPSVAEIPKILVRRMITPQSESALQAT